MIRPMTCPICEKSLPPEINGGHRLFPFCSTQCKQVDLYHWFSGDYAVVETLTPDKAFEAMSEEDLPPELLE